MTLSGEKLNSILMAFGIDVAKEIRDNQEKLERIENYLTKNDWVIDQSQYAENNSFRNLVKEILKILKEKKN